jgi:DNA topoisomerase-1
LIITEKPDAANKIALALDIEGKPRKRLQEGVPFYSAYRDGEIVVVPALGQLYTVANKQKTSRSYPVFDYQWIPRYQSERGAQRFRIWLKVIAQLAEGAEGFVDACDFDIEGSVIGYTILRYACGGKESSAKRMKYSTLTIKELQQSYANLLPTLDFALVQAGLTRHEVDWLYGINLSRALISSAKSWFGRYLTLSTGRVQGPTLKFLEDREKIIQSFVPTRYWIVSARISVDGGEFEVEYEKTLETIDEAAAVRDNCRAKEGTIKTVILKEFEKNPPFPFDLGSLQSEAYRIFKYTPMRTSSATQHLYLNALISYPRTSSQKLPSSIGYQKILKKLSKSPIYSKAVAELIAKSALKPNDGKKIDPAHPAIYPTGNLPEKPLGTVERNIFDLIVKRFFAVFAKPAICESIKVTFNINNYLFRLNSARTLSEGWLTLYKPYFRPRNTSLPLMTEGQAARVKRVALKACFTKPPARYNLCTLLEKMETEEIGTKATRATVMQALLDRKYVLEADGLIVSDLGSAVIDVLSKYCPVVISSDMTRALEERMDQIRQGRETKEAVLENAVATLKPILSALKEDETTIGAQLNRAHQKALLKERLIGVCPTCTGGKLVVLRSKTSGKRFVGCTNYFEGKCHTAFPLPQFGTVKTLGKSCKICGSPIVEIFLRGKRPSNRCLNPGCSSRKNARSEKPSLVLRRE